MTQIYNHAGKVDNSFIELKDSPYLILNMCDKPCYSFYTLGHIKVDGTINICRFGMDHEFDIGHINDGFMECWFGEKARDIRARAKKDQIETCNKCLIFLCQTSPGTLFLYNICQQTIGKFIEIAFYLFSAH